MYNIERRPHELLRSHGFAIPHNPECAYCAGNSSPETGPDNETIRLRQSERAEDRQETNEADDIRQRKLEWKHMLNEAKRHSATVCPSWKRFGLFDRWLRGSGWRCGLTLVRLDRTGAFKPGNVIAVTARQKRSDRKRRGKMTIREARKIRRRLADGERQAELAREYGVSRATVNKIARRKTFRDI